MTLKKAIDDYKLLNPSTPYSDDKLTEFVQGLDRMVQTEILHTFPYVVTVDADTGEIIKTAGTLISYSYTEDANTELLLSGSPFEDVYVLYITAMVYFGQSDWMKYGNAKGMFNARYAEAATFYARNYPRIQENKIRNYW